MDKGSAKRNWVKTRISYALWMAPLFIILFCKLIEIQTKNMLPIKEICVDILFIFIPQTKNPNRIVQRKKKTIIFVAAMNYDCYWTQTIT